MHSVAVHAWPKHNAIARSVKPPEKKKSTSIISYWSVDVKDHALVHPNFSIKFVYPVLNGYSITEVRRP